jgi:hypothetical protein
MQQTSPDTPGNTKDGLCSRNTRISCSLLTTKHAWYIPHSKNIKPHLKPVAQNVIIRNSQNDTTSRYGLVERSNGTLCAAARSMVNHSIFQWDKSITAELWPFAIEHATTIYNTTKRRSHDYDLSPWEQFTGERSKLGQTDMHPLLCPVYMIDRQMQEGASPHKCTKQTTQKVYAFRLHHYSKSVPMIWDPKTKLVSPPFHIMFNDNFDTAKAPDPNIKQADDRLF